MALGPTQLSAYKGAFSQNLNGRGMKQTTYLHRLPRLRMSGAVPSVPIRFHAGRGTALPLAFTESGIKIYTEGDM
jgi:hypothetical protein